MLYFYINYDSDRKSSAVALAAPRRSVRSDGETVSGGLISTNPLRAATISVADLDRACAAYGKWLDYRAVEDGAVNESFARSAGSPALTGRRYRVLRPASGRYVFLRLIESPLPPPGYRPMRSYGWSAIELCVEDVFGTNERLQGGPFDIIGPPLSIATIPTIHPMQVQAPDGELIFLTQILDQADGNGLPRAQAPVDTLFICVLACRDLVLMSEWVSRQLGATIDPPIDIPYRTINRAFGLPAEQLHRLATARRGQHIFLELDQYPDFAEERPREFEGLVPGIGILTISHPNLDAIEGPWLTPPERRDEAIYGGARAGMLRSPEGALFELVEQAA